MAILVSVDFARADSKEIKVSFTISAELTTFSKIREPFEKATGIKFKYVHTPVEATGVQIVKDLDQGLVDVVSVPAVFEDVIKAAEESHYTIKNKAEFRTRVIGMDFIQFFTHADGPKNFGLPEAKRILLGEVTNWKQLGGANLPIQLFLTPGLPGTKKVIEERLLDKKLIPDSIIHYIEKGTSSTELVEKVSKTPGAIAFVGIAAITSKVNAPKAARLGRPMTMAFRLKPTPELQKLFDFISAEGAKLGAIRPENE